MQSPIITVVYSHGRFGSPWYGFKIEALRVVALARGINMVSIRYPEEMPVADMEAKLLTLVKDDVSVPGDLIFLSSSRGAYISTRISQRVVDLFATESERTDDDKTLPRRHVLGQFLIAPAFYIKPDYYPDQDPTPASVPTAIVHGFNDDIINPDNSIRFARRFNCQLHLLEGGHRLNSQRDRLCALFDVFLGDAIASSAAKFEDWKLAHPQAVSESDSQRPGARTAN